MAPRNTNNRQPAPPRQVQLQITKQKGPSLNTVSMLWYGESKVGKTEQAARFPNSLILSCEPEGTDYLAGEHDVVHIKTLDHLAETVAAVAGTQYRTIVLDGLTWIINQEARRIVHDRKMKDPRRAYAQVTDKANYVINTLLKSGKSVIATGHHRVSDTVIDEASLAVGNGQAAPSTQHGSRDDGNAKKTVHPDVNPALLNAVVGGFSHICYCYSKDGKSWMLTRPVDTPNVKILAGSRGSVFPAKLELTMEAVLAAFKSSATKAKATVETTTATVTDDGTDASTSPEDDGEAYEDEDYIEDEAEDDADDGGDNEDDPAN